jgi:hypothetical protein
MDTELLLVTQACCVKQNSKTPSFVLQTCWLHLVKALQSTLRNGLFEMGVRVVYLFQYFKSSKFGLLGSSLNQVPLTSPKNFNKRNILLGYRVQVNTTQERLTMEERIPKLESEMEE